MNNLKDYFNAIGQRESGNNYKAVNSFGYIGKYQMGEQAMVDAGYYKPKMKYNNDWSGEFTGKDGIYSVQNFLNNPIAQENAMRIYKNKQWSYIKKFAPYYTGKVINGYTVTYSGMLAACHLLGQNELENYLKSGGRIKTSDGYGTNIEEYLQKFSGFDVSEITGLKEDFENLNYIQKGKYKDYYKPFEIGIEYNDLLPLSSSIFGDIPLALMECLQKKVPSDEELDFVYNELCKYFDLKSQETKQQQPQSALSSYTNPITEKDRIFTREEIGKMTPKEYEQNEEFIHQQLKLGNVMSKAQANEEVRLGNLIWVDSYVRSDGTQVSGYYRRR